MSGFSGRMVIAIDILGKMGDHNVAIGYMPQGSQGIGAAATVATDTRITFTSIQLRLLVCIGGGIPSKKNDIRLGDVVLGMPDGIHGGVVQYDLGKRTVDAFERKGFLCPPPDEWRTAVVEMKSDHEVKSNHIAEFLSKMLAAGLSNEFPCVVIRGICDYAALDPPCYLLAARTAKSCDGRATLLFAMFTIVVPTRATIGYIDGIKVH
jgi:hypothetical protein